MGIIIISITLQLLTAFFAVRLVFLTKKYAVGILIILATFLMVFRRSISFYRVINGETVRTDQSAEIIACVVSFLFLIGVIYLTKLILSAKEADKVLIEGENKFRSIFEQANDGIMIADPVQKRNIEANRAICAMLGYTRDELISLRIEDTHPKEDLPRLLDLFERQVRGEVSLASDVSMLRKDGSVLYVDINATSVTLGGKQCLMGIFRDITERKKAEEKLQKSELRLRESQEVAKIGSWSVDVVNNTLDWSDETFRRFDKDPATFTTSVEYFVGLIHPDDRETVQKAIQDALENNTPYHVQPRIINETGREWVMEAFGRAERDSNGKPLRFAGTAQDITERMQVEEALRESEKRYHTLFEQSPDGILLIDTAGKIIEFNETAHRQLGYSRGEFAELRLSDIDPVESPEEIQASIGKVLEAGQAEFVVKHRTKDGEVRDVNVITQGIVLAGKPVMYAIWHDITDRKRAEDALREIEHSFQVLFEQAAVGVAQIRSETGQFLRINQKYCDILGYSREEMERLDFQTITHPDDLARDLANIEMLKTGKIREFTVEKRYFRKDGSIVWVNLTVSPMWQPGERPGVHIAVAQDITDRKRAEEELLKEKIFEDRLINSMPGIFYLFDENGHIMRWNRNMEIVSGYSAEEMGKLNPLDFFFGGDKKLVGEAIQEVFVSGASNVEAGFISKDGRRTPYYFTGLSFLWDNRPYLVGMGIDITERKKTEESLRESEAKFKAMVETLPLAIYLSVGIEQTCEYLNPMFIKLFGYTIEEIPTASQWWPLAYPDEIYRRQLSEEWTTRVKHAIETQSPIEPMEVVVTCKDGWKKNISWGYIAMGDKNYAYGLDLTERKQAEATLQESEREFRLLAEAMPQIVWVTRPDGWNIYFNHQWVDYTGMTLEESYGHGWNVPFHPDDKQRAWDAWQNATQNGATYALECRLRRADGAYKWWLIRGVPVMDAGGIITKWFGTCTDIDNMKLAEDKIHNLNKELEQRVVERTEQLEVINRNLQDEITRHMKSQEDLKESVQRFQLAAESGQLGVWDWNVVSNFMVWNNRMFELYGISRDAFPNSVEA
ncbi:MAG: PAS domain S-box protein [Dissulfurispiraceae bacterium]|jgi:PAS domain S-box-containing protein